MSGLGAVTCPMLSWPSKYGVDNAAARARRRRIVNHDTMPAIKTATPIPPTTPPAIAPSFELPLEGEFDGDDDLGEVACGVTVDWSLLVEVGTTEAVPVTSGASVIGSNIRKFLGLVDKVTHRQQAAPPLNSSYRRAAGEMRSDQLGKKQ